MSQQKHADEFSPEQRTPPSSRTVPPRQLSAIFFWLPIYSRQSAALLALTRSWFELMLRTPTVMAPLLRELLSPGSFDMAHFSGRRSTFDPGRRSSAVIINFPDRRKTGT